MREKSRRPRLPSRQDKLAAAKGVVADHGADAASRPAPEIPEPAEPPVVAGPASVPGFQFCAVAEVDRLLRVFQGGVVMLDVPITPLSRLAFGVHQIRIGLMEMGAATPPQDQEATSTFLLDAVRRLINQTSGASAQLDLVLPQPAAAKQGAH